MAVDYFAHIGVCVEDMEISRRFYRDVLGFEESGELRIADDVTASLLEIPGVSLHAIYLDRDGTRIELLHYPEPGATGTGERRPMNERGLTHLALRVSDLDTLCNAIEAAGGRIIEATRRSNPAYRSRVCFATDPDGTRIELVEAPGDPSLPPGEAPSPAG